MGGTVRPWQRVDLVAVARVLRRNGHRRGCEPAPTRGAVGGSGSCGHGERTELTGEPPALRQLEPSKTGCRTGRREGRVARDVDRTRVRRRGSRLRADRANRPRSSCRCGRRLSVGTSTSTDRAWPQASTPLLPAGGRRDRVRVDTHRLADLLESAGPSVRGRACCSTALLGGPRLVGAAPGAQPPAPTVHAPQVAPPVRPLGAGIDADAVWSGAAHLVPRRVPAGRNLDIRALEPLPTVNAAPPGAHDESGIRHPLRAGAEGVSSGRTNDKAAGATSAAAREATRGRSATRVFEGREALVAEVTVSISRCWCWRCTREPTALQLLALRCR